MAIGPKSIVKSAQERASEPVEAAACFYLGSALGRRILLGSQFGLLGVLIGALRQRRRSFDPANWPPSVVLAATAPALNVYAATYTEKASDLVVSLAWAELSAPSLDQKSTAAVLTFTRPHGQVMTLKTKALGMNHNNPKVAEWIVSRITKATPAA